MKKIIIMSCSVFCSLMFCDINHDDTIEDNHGTVVITCEHGPYYINIDSLKNCTGNKQCSYTAMSVDSLHSDFIIQRSGNGFKIHDITTTSSAVNVEYDEVFEITKDNSQFSVYIHNVYIGGCYNDEIRWSKE